MIIFGTRTKLLLSESVPDNCASCGRSNSMQMNIFQKYAHVFWIPFIPIGKTATTECSHCKNVQRKNEFQGSYNDIYRDVKSRTRIPVWTFSGLILLAGLFVAAYISVQRDKAENRQLILAPQVNDIYEIRNGFRNYTLYKVNGVSADTVFVLLSNYETNKASRVDDLLKESDAFGEEEVPFLKSELQAMLEKGEIRDIERE